MSNENYIKLGDLDVYKMAVDLGRMSWKIYDNMNWQDKKIIGDQFIRSIDSIGANIAEGYGRYHYKDRMKFYYNSRGSLFESRHWSLLLFERRKIDEQQFQDLLNKLDNINKKLNSYIKACYNKI